MKLSNTLAALLLISNAAALAHPPPHADNLIEQREFDPRSAERIFAAASELYKRKGGGGGGSRGGGSSSSSSSGGGSSSSGSSGSNSRSSSSNRGSSSSNAGGATKSGSGAPKSFGGGRYYGGGASTPYTPGKKSPAGITPLAVGVGVGGAAGVAGAVALSHYPGVWPYGFYSYPYANPYVFYNHTGRRNRTATSTSSSTTATPTSAPAARSFPLLISRQADDSGDNESKPVTCLCDPYAVCGCDEPSSSDFLNSIIGDGTYASLNKSVVDVADINGTSTIVLNGTLPNGTTASGGTDDATSGATSSSSIAGISGSSGYFVMIGLVGCTVFML